MIEALERFGRELRREGLEVSLPEWLDALRAVEAVGVDDRATFRTALEATLAKGARRRQRFRAAFDRFFVGPSVGRGKGERRGGGAAGSAKTRRGDADTGRGTGPVRARSRGIASLIDAATARAGARSGRLRKVVLRPAGRKAPSPHMPESRGRTAVERRDVTRRMGFADEQALAAEVPRLVAELRLRSGRRQRRDPAGKPWLRQLFRDNLRHGGVPFDVPRRRRRPASPTPLLLVDVSWSTARAAGLFLSMAGEFLRRLPKTRVVVFVDRPVEAGREIVAYWQRTPTLPAVADAPGPGSATARGGVSFARLLGGLEGLDPGAPSDYGRVFHALAAGRRAPRRDTLLVVLGDGRTNRFDPQAFAFEELAAGCGAVLWLVPEPVARWGAGDSALEAYLPHADVAVEAADLKGLAAGVRELVRRL